MEFVKAIYGSGNTSYSERPRFECYGNIYECSNSVDLIFYSQKDKRLRFIEYNNETIIKNDSGDTFYRLNDRSVEVVGDVDLMSKSTYDMVKTKGESYIKFNNLTINIANNAYVMFSNSDWLVIYHLDFISVFNKECILVKKINIKGMKKFEIDHSLYFSNEKLSIFYYFDFELCELKEIESVIVSRSAEYKFASNIGVIGDDSVYKIYDNLYIGECFRPLDLNDGERVKSAHAKKDILYAIFFNDNRLFSFDRKLNFLKPPLSLPECVDCMIDLTSNGTNNIARFTNSANSGMEYFSIFNDNEFLEAGNVEVDLEEDLYEITVANSETGLDVVINCNCNYEYFIRHSFAGFDEVVWRLCYDHSSELFLKNEKKGFSGKCKLIVRKNELMEEQLNKILQICEERNRFMMFQKIKGTDITPRLEIIF